MDEMQNQELCILLDSLLALLETNNVEKAKEVIRNAINRIDKGTTSSTRDQRVVSERQSVNSAFLQYTLLQITKKCDRIEVTREEQGE